MDVSKKTLVEFELCVMDLVEAIGPNSVGEYESIADILHQCIETAVTDMVHDDENIEDPDEYIPSY